MSVCKTNLENRHKILMEQLTKKHYKERKNTKITNMSPFLNQFSTLVINFIRKKYIYYIPIESDRRKTKMQGPARYTIYDKALKNTSILVQETKSISPRKKTRNIHSLHIYPTSLINFEIKILCSTLILCRFIIPLHLSSFFKFTLF